jgi:hypothetical protein
MSEAQQKLREHQPDQSVVLIDSVPLMLHFAKLEVPLPRK